MPSLACTISFTSGPAQQGGWTGATSTPSAVGAPGYGYAQKVIGNWTEVPYQSFTDTATFAALVFHKADYTRRLRLDYAVDQGTWKTGSAVTITPGLPSSNPRDVNIALNASNYRAGPLTLRGIAYPSNGVPRVLDDLPLNAQPSGGSGRYYPVYAYVSESAADDAHGVASPTWATALASPFKYIHTAAAAIKSYRNSNFSLNNGDFGVIRLSPELHTWPGGGARVVVTDATWFTIEPAPGHDWTDTSLNDTAGGGGIFCNRLHLKNIKILTTAGHVGYINNSDPSGDAQTHLLWLDTCRIIGAGRELGTDASTPFGVNWDATYYTNNNITDIGRPTQIALLIRGNTVARISNDFSANCPMIAHNVVDDIDPLLTAEHADGVQYYTRATNFVVYDTVLTNLKYQGFFMFEDPPSTTPPTQVSGVALVDNTISGDATGHPDYAGDSGQSASLRPWSSYGAATDHLLWWDLQQLDKYISIVTEDGGNGVISNWSARNCKFRQLVLHPTYAANADITDFDGCSFNLISGDPGADPYASGAIGTNASRWT